MNSAAAAMLLCLMVPAGVAAEPQILEDRDLDAVTAGGVLVEVSSFADAFGDRGRTLTDAKTFALLGRSYALGVGLTFGHGFACCGEPAAVGVGSAVLGAGDIVRYGTRKLEHDDGSFAQGLSGGYVVALTFNKPLLRQLRPILAEAGSKLRASGVR